MHIYYNPQKTKIQPIVILYNHLKKIPRRGISGALSKNRTCDSSLPRTCFTTRLLGLNFPPIIRTRHKKSSIKTPRHLNRAYIIFRNHLLRFHRHPIQPHSGQFPWGHPKYLRFYQTRHLNRFYAKRRIPGPYVPTRANIIDAQKTS